MLICVCMYVGPFKACELPSRGSTGTGNPLETARGIIISDILTRDRPVDMSCRLPHGFVASSNFSFIPDCVKPRELLAKTLSL